MAIVFVALVFAIYICRVTWSMAVRPDYHPWPGITRCLICEKRIYAWDHYERRAMAVDQGNVAGTCLVHKGCKGHPKLEVLIKRK